MPGEIVSVDIGIEYQGYFGDAAKTYAIDKVDAERERLMQVTWDSLYKGIGQAVAILVGQRLGANEADLAERTTWTALKLTVAYTVFTAAIYLWAAAHYLLAGRHVGRDLAAMRTDLTETFA